MTASTATSPAGSGPHGAGDAVFEVAANGAVLGTCGVGAPCGPLPAGDAAVLAVTAVRGSGSLDALEFV